MKKFLFSFAVLLCLHLPSPLFAQSLPGYLYLSAAAAGSADAGIAELKFLNEKVYRSFTSSFVSAEDVRSHMEGNNIFVSCLIDSIRTRLLYNTKGREVYRVRYFTAERLPYDIMEFVNEEFHRYTVLHGAQVTTQKGSAFLVNIRYKNTCKTVKIVDGRFDVVNTFYCQE